jgi:GH18 family chitinase
VAAEVLTHGMSLCRVFVSLRERLILGLAVNFAFALISSSFQLIEMASGDHNLWRKTTDLKKRNAGLEVWLSVGGWTFNDPPTSHIFSDLVSDDANVKKFIISALSVMQAYGFDGIDIDWEYPAAYDRGGKPSDKDNYTKFMKKVKSAFQSKYGLSFTAPSSYWYLQHFDIPSLIDVVDFVNVMSYDLHGVAFFAFFVSTV